MADEVLKIETHGTKELARALRQMGDGSEKELKASFARIAGGVADKVRPKVAHLTGAAAASYKGRGSTRGGSIAFGGTAAPYAPWLDFGGAAGPNKSIKRPFVKEGRYLYPTIKAEQRNIIKEVDEVTETLARKAGFD